MTSQAVAENDPGIQLALATLKSAIASRFPAAMFEVFHRDDPAGIRLRTTVDVEDTEVVLDAVIDLLSKFQVEQSLPVYVIPVQPLSRISEQINSSQPH